MKLMVILFALAMCGCATSRMSADGRRAESEALRSMAHCERSPQVGKIYAHNGGKGLRVLQAVNGGVLVRPYVGEWEFEFRGPDAIAGLLTIYVETPEIYVDGEYLREGLYEFVGRYEYSAVNDRRATVRKFREVKPASEQ